MKTLIRKGTILTLDEEGHVLEGEDIVVEDERIARVGGHATESDGPFDRVIDASGHLVMPGLINAHCHSYDVFRGLCEDMPQEIWMLYGGPLFQTVGSHRELMVRTQLVAAEMLLSGTTTCVDNISLWGLSPELVGGTLQAYHRLGIRICAAPIVTDRPFTHTLPYLDEILPEKIARLLNGSTPPSLKAVLDYYRHVIEQWDGRDGRVHVVLAPAAPIRCSDDLLVALGTMAKEGNRPVHTHVLETKVEAVAARDLYGQSMIRHLRDLGLVSPLLSVIHGVWLSRDDIRILAEGDANVVLNPACNLRLLSGVAPIRELIEAGVNVALGTDNASANDTHNLFETLKLTALLRNTTGAGSDGSCPAVEALRMGTLGGARSVGLDREVGALAVGRRADLVLLDLSRLSFVPLNNLPRQLVYCELGTSVRTVLVDGCIVLQDGKLIAVDLEGLRAEARELADQARQDYRQVRDVADRLRPYFEQMYRRAINQDVGFSAFLSPR